MKYSIYSLAAVAVASAVSAAAVPLDLAAQRALEKRFLVVETEYKTVTVETTITLGPGQQPTPLPQQLADAAASPEVVAAAAVVAETSSSAPLPTSTSAAVSSSSAPPPTTSVAATSAAATSVATTPVASPTTTPAAPQPTPTTLVAQPPKAAPVVAAVVAPAAPAPAVGAGGGPSSDNGDLTFYEVGLGACGQTNTDGEAVVAISYEIYKPSLCGQTITISYGGHTTTAKVVDKCMGCQSGGIDASPSLFQEFASFGAGRLHGVKWQIG